MFNSQTNWVLKDFRTFTEGMTGDALRFRAITGQRLIASEPDSPEMAHARKVLACIEGMGR